MAKVRVLTGIKPSGSLHVGNYFGAILPLLDFQNANNELFVFVAEYHAMNSVHSADKLRKTSREILKIYLACGLDAEKSTVYMQSAVPEVQELAWIFSSLTSMPELMRAHAYKDAVQKNKTIPAGTFTYPLLMAADIAIMRADVVPVGKDQVQHVEMAREMVRDFNANYGEFLKEPKEYLHKDTQTVIGTDGRKMSKSYNNVIPIIGSDEEWKRAVFSIQTDSTPLGSPIDPSKCAVFALHKLISKDDLPEIEKGYKEGTMGFKESKEILFENIKKKFAPIREAYDSISDEHLDKLIKEGAQKAQNVARENMREIRKLVGLSSV